jgi:transposase
VKQHIVALTPEERDRLRDYTRTGARSAQAITRARILLAADSQGQARNDADIARSLGVSVHTVENTRKRYCAQGLEAVLERKPRRDKGRPVKLDGRVQAHLVALACSSTPNDEPSWTLSMLAERLVKLELVESVSREAVRQVLKKHAQAAPQATVVHPA